jgi:TonB family protein
MTNPAPAPSVYYLAEVAARKLSIRLHLGVVDRLAREILNPSRPGDDEVGGILLGTVAGAGKSVVIEDYQTVTRRLRQGRFYDSDLDRAALDRAVRLWRPDADSKIQVVGLFRSDSQTRLKPESGDVVSLSRLLPQTNGVLLLIGPGEKSPSAALHFAEGGQLRRGSSRVGFPFIRSELVNGDAAQQSADSGAGGKVLQLAAPIRQKNDAGSAAPTGRHRFLLRGAVVAGAVAALAGAGLTGYRVAGVVGSQAAAPTRASSALGLKTERDSSELVLNWNPGAPALATAARGHLSITDGGNVKQLDLDLNELKRGKMAYIPSTNDVTFRLEIFDAQQRRSAAEWKRVLSAAPLLAAGLQDTVVADAIEPVKPEARPLAPMQKPFVSSFFANGTALQPQRPTTHVSPAATGVETPAPAASGGLETSAQAQTADQSAAERFTVSGQAQPPEVPARSEPLHEAILPAPLVRLPGPPAESAKPAVQATTPAVTRVSAPPPASIKAGGRAEKAVLLRKTLPVYPPEAARKHISGVVRIAATIGQNGRVKNASAVDGPVLLREAAVKAVQAWQYKPAFLDGKPVDVEAEINVAFKSHE